MKLENLSVTKWCSIQFRDALYQDFHSYSKFQAISGDNLKDIHDSQ